MLPISQFGKVDALKNSILCLSIFGLNFKQILRHHLKELIKSEKIINLRA